MRYTNGKSQFPTVRHRFFSVLTSPTKFFATNTRPNTLLVAVSFPKRILRACELSLLILKHYVPNTDLRHENENTF